MNNYAPDIVRDSMDDYLKKLNNHAGITKTIATYQTKAGRASAKANKRVKTEDNDDEVLFFRSPETKDKNQQKHQPPPKAKDIRKEMLV